MATKTTPKTNEISPKRSKATSSQPSKRSKLEPSLSLPTLYRTNADGCTNQWRVWAEQQGEKVFLMTEFGRVGGVLRLSSKEVTVLGRHLTLLEHAQHEAKKKWEDKQSKEGYITNLENAAAALHQESMDAPSNPKSNDVPVLPMLANTATLVDGNVQGITSWPVMVQPKIDGFRCVARVTGGCCLTSRKNIPYQGFQSIRDAINTFDLPSEGFGSGRFYLDGEFYVETEGDFGKLSSAVKKGQTRKDYDLPDKLMYLIYDCFDLDHMDTPFEKRFETMRRLVTTHPHKQLIALTTETSESSEQIMLKMHEYVSKGHEGLMIRDRHSPYVLRKRSKHLLKVKEFQDSEFEIVGHSEGQGQDAGTVIWQCKTKESNNLFMVRPMGTHEYRSELLKQAEEHYGKWLTVKYFGLDPRTDIPRFPVGKTIREEFDYAP